MRAVRTLHQFPRSHYCEKVRWHLDAKGLDYQIRNLFPGTHARVNRRLAGHSSVPLLIDGDRAIHDSSEIALYLEQTYPRPALLPDDEGLRALALALQSYFSATVGPAVRHWLYGQLLRQRGMVTKLFFRGYGRTARWTGRLLSPIFEHRLARLYPPDDASLARVETAVMDGVERLENTIDRNPDRYLVGGALSLADVTAAALLAPVIGPPGSPWYETAQFTPAVVRMQEQLRTRVGGQWVLRRYARDRLPAQTPLSLESAAPDPALIAGLPSAGT